MNPPKHTLGFVDRRVDVTLFRDALAPFVSRLLGRVVDRAGHREPILRRDVGAVTTRGGLVDPWRHAFLIGQPVLEPVIVVALVN